MNRARAVFPALMAFVVVICVATVAKADPIRVTDGELRAGFGPVGGLLSGEGLSLVAGGFSIQTSLEEPSASFHLAAVPTLTTGALVDFSGALRGNDALGAQQNGSFVLVGAPFAMFFTASPTPITCSSADSFTQCTGAAPFTFDAKLTVTPPGGAASIRHLIGGGTVEGSLFRGGSSEAMANVLFTFAPTSPTPEPATLSLLTAGALVAAGRWRRPRAIRRGLHSR
jgi:PEP-CTERM motif-containing protein